MEQRTVITVSEDVIDLVPGFLERRREDVSRLREELKQADGAAIAFRAHMMKGSSGSFGFDHLMDLSAQLERAGNAGDLITSSRLIDAIAFHLENLEVASE